MLKKHPYRKLALSLPRSSPSSSSSPSPGHPRVLGLTASYTYAVGDAKTKASLTALCRALGIINMEIATKELEASGINTMRATAEVRLPPATITPPGILPEADRKSRVAATTFFGREAQGSGTNFARLLMACIRSMENIVLTEHQSQFASPLPPSGKLLIKSGVPTPTGSPTGSPTGPLPVGEELEEELEEEQEEELEEELDEDVSGTFTINGPLRCLPFVC